MKRKLTKRAPDAGDSAAISSSFLRLITFLAGRLRRPRPGCRAGRDTAQVTQTVSLLVQNIGGSRIYHE